MQISITSALGMSTSRSAYDSYHTARLMVAGSPDSLVPLRYEQPLVTLLNLLQEVEGYEWGPHIELTMSAAQEMAQEVGLELSFSR